MKQAQTLKFTTTAGAAKRLDVTPAAVRAMSNSGRLESLRTDNGTRIFRVEDVDRLKAEREARKS